MYKVKCFLNIQTNLCAGHPCQFLMPCSSVAGLFNLTLIQTFVEFNCVGSGLTLLQTFVKSDNDHLRILSSFEFCINMN